MDKGFIGTLFFAIIVAIFALKNGDKVLIDFLFIKIEVSQAIVILASSILGAVTVSILGIVKNLKFKKQIKHLNKTIEVLGKEKEDLESLLTIKEGQNVNESIVDDHIDHDAINIEGK